MQTNQNEARPDAGGPVGLPREQSMQGGPYQFQCGAVTVKMEFIDQERTLQERLETFFIGQKQQWS